MSIRPFEREGNYTAVDNAVLDHLMCELSGNEFKVLMTIVRRTVGWHEQQAGISVREFHRITGIASFQTISKALANLVELGIIIREDVGQRAIYSLNRDYELKTVTENGTVTVTEIVTDEETVTKTVTPTVTKTVTPTATETVTVSYIEKKEKERGKKHARAGIPPPQSPEEGDVAFHPAMETWIRAGFDWPGYITAPEIIRRLGDAPDLDMLIQARQFWQMSGYRSGNLLGILDWYDELRDDPNWSPGPSRNGNRKKTRPREQAPASW